MSNELPLPWPRVKTGDPLDFTILTIREDVLRHPQDGTVHPRVIIDSPDWVNVLALTPDERVILVRQYRAGAAVRTLELPGGMVDRGESAERAAARELEEETGFRAARVVPLGFVHPNPALQSNRLHAYLALDCTRVESGPQLDPGEDIVVELYPYKDLPKLVREGKITHALVVATLFLAEHQER